MHSASDFLSSIHPHKINNAFIRRYSKIDAKIKKQTKSEYKLSFDNYYSNYASVSQILGENMKVAAKVTFDNGTFDEWAEFFESYRLDREQFITNETIKKVSSLEARVEFEIKDLEGLTDLSSRKDIITREKELGVKTEII